MTDTLTVAEVFGNTVQGEGPSLGRRAAFLRLGGCNLTCSWCDTPYTWDWANYNPSHELSERTAADVVTELRADASHRVVITGGEPLLQQRRSAWRAVLVSLWASGTHVEVETNGTVPPTDFTHAYVTQFNVSPKLSNAHVDPRRTTRPHALAAFARSDRSVFKFVCATPADVTEANQFVSAHNVATDKVWISPLGTDRDAVSASITATADTAMRYGYNLTTRLHIHAWGDQRGR